MGERKKIADDAHLPPYVIFPEKAMAEMAYYLPMSEESLLSISGVGEVKLKRYGKRFKYNSCLLLERY